MQFQIAYISFAYSKNTPFQIVGYTVRFVLACNFQAIYVYVGHISPVTIMWLALQLHVLIQIEFYSHIFGTHFCMSVTNSSYVAHKKLLQAQFVACAFPYFLM